MPDTLCGGGGGAPASSAADPVDFSQPWLTLLVAPLLVPLLLQVLETLVRLKRKDPVLKQPDVVLFPEPDDSGDDNDGDDAAAAAAGDKKSKKPMYLRTVLAQQVRSEGGVRNGLLSSQLLGRAVVSVVISNSSRKKREAPLAETTHPSTTLEPVTPAAVTNVHPSTAATFTHRPWRVVLAVTTMVMMMVVMAVRCPGSL